VDCCGLPSLHRSEGGGTLGPQAEPPLPFFLHKALQVPCDEERCLRSVLFLGSLTDTDTLTGQKRKSVCDGCMSLYDPSSTIAIDRMRAQVTDKLNRVRQQAWLVGCPTGQYHAQHQQTFQQIPRRDICSQPNAQYKVSPANKGRYLWEGQRSQIALAQRCFTGKSEGATGAP
jgi:hypothetical protein